MCLLGMNAVLWLTLMLGLVNLGLGFWNGSPAVFAAAACAMGYVGVRRSARLKAASAIRSAPPPTPAATFARPPSASSCAVDPNDTEALVEQMLSQGRYALLLRPQIAGTLGGAIFHRVLEAFHHAMAVVPEGEVSLCDEDNPEAPARMTRVEAFFLDRYPVTNRFYYEFVTAGGYEQMALWDTAVWPAVLDFVDRTAQPGPRYWQHGCYLPGEEDLPVVGVSWYEAAACARWLGKRLPSDAEWVKAVAWPVPISPTSRAQRRYPWGDAMDRTKANVWGSGKGGVAAVTEFAGGVSVGGVYQLIGNVWEWTTSPLRTQRAAGELTPDVPMKSLRGGAFDTYFDNQGSCQFQSGDNPLARRYNIGFRCVIGLGDLMLSAPREARQRPAAETAPHARDGVCPSADSRPSSHEVLS